MLVRTALERTTLHLPRGASCGHRGKVWGQAVVAGGGNGHCRGSLWTPEKGNKGRREEGDEEVERRVIGARPPRPCSGLAAGLSTSPPPLTTQELLRGLGAFLKDEEQAIRVQMEPMSCLLIIWKGRFRHRVGKGLGQCHTARQQQACPAPGCYSSFIHSLITSEGIPSRPWAGCWARAQACLGPWGPLRLQGRQM